jgi:hypothetical protein
MAEARRRSSRLPGLGLVSRLSAILIRRLFLAFVVQDNTVAFFVFRHG